MLRRHTHFHHYAVPIAFLARALLAGQRDMATRDALREFVEPPHSLQNVVLDPFRALDVVVDHLRRDLHIFLIYAPAASSRPLTSLIPARPPNPWFGTGLLRDYQ